MKYLTNHLVVTGGAVVIIGAIAIYVFLYSGDSLVDLDQTDSNGQQSVNIDLDQDIGHNQNIGTNDKKHHYLKDDSRPALVPQNIESFLSNRAFFWQEENSSEGLDSGWETSLSEAEAYRYSNEPLDRLTYLKNYQRILDQNPPPDVDARMRLEMGAALTINFSPPLDTEAISWYADLINRHKDLESHRTILTAKIHLAELILRQNGRDSLTLANRLFEEVLNTPTEQVVFDHPSFQRLNINSIESSSHPSLVETNQDFPQNPRLQQLNSEHKQKLYESRQKCINSMRQAAMQSYLYSQMIPGVPEANSARVAQIRSDFSDDDILIDVIESFTSREEKTYLKPYVHEHNFEDGAFDAIPGQ